MNVSPVHILTLASVAFGGAMCGRAIYAQVVTLVLLISVCCAQYEIAYVGMHAANPWAIKLSIGALEQCVCLAATGLALVHLHERPEQRVWCTASLLACTGIALAADLFHTYVWLEVLTFASLGFVRGPTALRDYWRIHVFAAAVTVIGVLSVYQDTGTLTMPCSGARESSMWLMLLGWCVKAGAGVWLLRGYNTLDARDAFYVGSLFTKAGALGVAKLAGYVDLGVVSVVGALMAVCGCIVAAISERQRQFAGAHMLCQAGSTLLVVSLVQDQRLIALYMLRNTLAEALLLSCLFGAARGWMSWCATLFAAGLPPSVGFVIKIAVWSACFTSNPYLALCLAVVNFGVAGYLIHHAVFATDLPNSSDVSRNLLALNVLAEALLIGLGIVGVCNPIICCGD